MHSGRHRLPVDDTGTGMSGDSKRIDRIVLLTIESAGTAAALPAFIERFHDRIVCIGLSQRNRTDLRTLAREGRAYRRRSGWPFLRYLIINFAVMPNLVGRLCGNRRGISELAERHGIPLVSLKDINRPGTVHRIKGYEPDLIISAFFDQILQAQIIATPKIGVINVHPGLLPQNRGPFPSFRAIFDGDTVSGASVHWITDTTIDTGDVIARGEIPIERRESVLALECRTLRTGFDLAADAIRAIAERTAPSLPQDPAKARYRSAPDRSETVAFRKAGGRFWRLADIWWLLRGAG